MKKKRTEPIETAMISPIDDHDDMNCDALPAHHDEIPITHLELFADAPPVRVEGSFKRSVIASFVFAYIARSNMSVLNAPMAAMTGLAQTSRSILAIAPLISGMMMPIPMSWLVHQSGGKYETLFMSFISSGGLLFLSATAAFTDLSKIDSVNLQYSLIFTSNFFIGFASASPFLFIDALKWTPDKKLVPKLQTFFNLIVDSASVTTPILILYLRSYGYFLPLIGFTFLSTLGAYATFFAYKQSPYNQFKSRFSKKQARAYAIEHDQLEELIGDQDTHSFKLILKENKNVLFDRRAIPLVLTFLSSLGSAWFTRLILPQVLITGFGLQQKDAIITSSLAYSVAIITRPITELIIKKWDKESGGVRVHLLGSILTIAGALALTNNIPTWGLYLSLGVFNIGFGINLVTPSTIATSWSVPTNTILKDFNPSNMLSLFGTLGTLGSIILPLLLGLMVEGTGQNGYQYFFYVIVALIALSGITMPILDKHVRDKESLTMCGRFGAFFTHRPSIAERAPAPERKADTEKLYLENIF